jgi:uncharacterized protein (DUF39 family)
MVVVIITILIDSEAGLIADFIPEQLSSSVGVAAFIGIAIIFAISQYFILAYVKQSNKETRARVLHLDLTRSIVSIAVYTSWDTCFCNLENHNNATVQHCNTLCFVCY